MSTSQPHDSGLLVDKMSDKWFAMMLLVAAPNNVLQPLQRLRIAHATKADVRASLFNSCRLSSTP